MTAPDSSPPRPNREWTGGVPSLLRPRLAVGGFLVLLALVSAVVIYPLWYLSTRAGALYTTGFFGLIAALAVCFFVLRWRRAVRNARLDEFFLKVTRFAVFTLFLLSQAFLTFVHIVWYGYLTGAAPFGVMTVLLYLAGCLTALVSLALPDAALRRKLLGTAGFVVATILFALQGAYWTAVFIARGAYPSVAFVILTILGFFFFQKITKIKRGEKKPNVETDIH